MCYSLGLDYKATRHIINCVRLYRLRVPSRLRAQSPGPMEPLFYDRSAAVCKALVTGWIARVASRVLATAPPVLSAAPPATPATASIAQQPIFRLLPIASVPRERRPAGRLLEA